MPGTERYVAPVAEVTRREFVSGGAFALLALAPAVRVATLIEEVIGGEVAGRFLTAGELRGLRAVTARLVPGPPDDPGPGALEVHAAESIDLLLGAFSLDPPLVHAGGPFSGRAGGERDDFADFVPLDHAAELGWRIRLEGSQGRPEREFAGPVLGLQDIYRSGLARLDQLARDRAGGVFAAAPEPVRDALLAVGEPTVQRLVDAALMNTLEALCGPPEYGGNHALAGWRGLHWPGDRQPDGFTPGQVTEADPPIAAATAAANLDSAAGERTEALRRIAPLLAGVSTSNDRWWAAGPGRSV